MSTGLSLVEQTFVNVWNIALNRDDVGLDDNFFEIGGDSLLALLTIEQINQRLGWRLNMGDILTHRTIRDLTANKTLLQAANTERVILRMSNRGTRTPIIFIHPVSGLIFAYVKLVQFLSDD